MKPKIIKPSNRIEPKEPAVNIGELIENFRVDAKVEVLRELVAETNSKVELLLATKKS
jgi:hypothetical protein